MIRKKSMTPQIHRERVEEEDLMNLGNRTTTTYSIFGRFVSCSVHITKPTCAQSFDLHSLQNGIPSTIFTTISFCSILSCNSALLPSANSFIIIGIERDFLFSAFSHKPKVATPSSRLLFLMPDDAFFTFLILFSDKPTIPLLYRTRHIVC
jgi:hypothetical protein